MPEEFKIGKPTLKPSPDLVGNIWKVVQTFDEYIYFNIMTLGFSTLWSHELPREKIPVIYFPYR